MLINKRVKVLAIYDNSTSILACRPVRMLYKNQEYSFVEIGLVHPTNQGKKMLHIFDVSDGSADYRLEFDAEQLIWTLISISDVYHEH